MTKLFTTIALLTFAALGCTAQKTETKTELSVSYNSLLKYGKMSLANITVRTRDGKTQWQQLKSIPPSQADRINESKAAFTIDISKDYTVIVDPVNGTQLRFHIPASKDKNSVHLTLDVSRCKEQPTYILYPRYVAGEAIWPDGKPKPSKCTR